MPVSLDILSFENPLLSNFRIASSRDVILAVSFNGLDHLLIKITGIWGYDVLPKRVVFAKNEEKILREKGPPGISWKII